ncbi:MAG: translation initiation factor IF-3 [Candidatus Marinimicrobia bacterium]|nr:translation initiation factor IF-3 [Candidatus Neomarinimicrobiota bacterium]
MAKGAPVLRVNDEITASEVRLVNGEGEQVGVVSLERAFAEADEAGLDLVEVSPDSNPPVTKIMDFGKFRYDQRKKDRENRKKQHTVSLKEIRMRPSISDHDLETKINRSIKFLQAGSRLKISVRFRGREMARQDLGAALMDRVTEQLEEYANVDKSASVEGRVMSLHLVPK